MLRLCYREAVTAGRESWQAARVPRISNRSTTAFSTRTRPGTSPLGQQPWRAGQYSLNNATTSKRTFSASPVRRSQPSPLDAENEQSYSDVHFPTSSAGPPPPPRSGLGSSAPDLDRDADGDAARATANSTDHAVISLFDLYSIGLGPSSSHTIGPMRAATIFIRDLLDRDPTLVPRISRLKIALYGALAATGEGHLTPQALLAGFEGEDPETADPDQVPRRYREILEQKTLQFGRAIPELKGGLLVHFDHNKDLSWHWDRQLPLHPNGMRFSVFSSDGDLLATNDYFSVGGGFVVNGSLATSPSDGGASSPTEVSDVDSKALAEPRPDELESHPADVKENIFYKQVRRQDADVGRRSGMAPVEDGVSSGQMLLGPDGAESVRSVGHLAGQNGRDVTATQASERTEEDSPSSSIPLPFHNGNSLLRLCSRHNLTIAQIVFQNELTWRTPEEVRGRIFKIWGVMDNAIRSGCHSTEERLPGPLQLRRRAPGLYRGLMRGLYPEVKLPPGAVREGRSVEEGSPPSMPGLLGQGLNADGTVRNVRGSSSLPAHPSSVKPSSGLAESKRVHGSLVHHPLPSPPRRSISNPAIDFLSVYAIAVNEENAAGRSVVTAPTLGSCGTIPSVLNWHLSFHSDDPEKDIETFLLTSAAIAMLFKRGASISAAEAGCMGEIGVATAMAAAGLTAVRGGTPSQIEHAAEIGIEHSMGLTCDPVNGQVAVPCIERNSMGAVKAVTASQLAMTSEEHAVSLDEAIAAMKDTAAGMSERFKETSLAGLATAVKIPVAVPAC